MDKTYAAHSISSKFPADEPHWYSDHVAGVQRRGTNYANSMLTFSTLSNTLIDHLKQSLTNALNIHDIGKLEEGNQEVLLGERTGRLPYDHVDAGVAVANTLRDQLAAWLVRAHHAPGLSSIVIERSLAKTTRLTKSNMLRGTRYHREDTSQTTINEHKKLISRTNEIIDELTSIHQETCGHQLQSHPTTPPEDALATRLLLSCLVDADHSDTAAYYQQGDESIDDILPRWQERLTKLTNTVNKMQGDDIDRQSLRDELYLQCTSAESTYPIKTCAAPVGLGKTTAVTAHLLQTAFTCKLRRVFIIAPFTNVISQTADRLRQYVTLPGEDPLEVVAEHHHRAEFSDLELRQYTQRWRAPIVVTTAVQFFETISSASPTALRKLHQWPRSAIFIDEAHACVPPKLMRQTWYWIKKLADQWSCHFVLASGSLVKYWEFEEIVGHGSAEKLPSLLSADFFRITQTAEHRRVAFSRLSENPIGKEEFLTSVINAPEPGSRLIILNTVQSAAVIAQSLQQHLQTDLEDNLPLSERLVLHISTALAPIDRERIIKELNDRQSRSSPWRKKNWYLVATSCVEAGVDLDFDFGYRERCSITSFLQIAGRINREGKNPNSVLYDLALLADGEIIAHPAFKDAIDIFNALWTELSNADSDLDDLSTKSLIREVQRNSNIAFEEKLYHNEERCKFQQVDKDFKIIASDTITVIVCDDICEKLLKGIPVRYREIQKNSVQLWRNKIDKYGVTPIDQSGNLYKWNFEYDASFLGYMKNLDSMIRQSGWVF